MPEHLPEPPPRPLPGLGLICASAAALALELALIRWLPGKVRVLAYFPNAVLLASFLGLGLGALWRRATAATVAGLLCVLLLAAQAAAGVAFTATEASEHLWLLYYDLPPDAPVVQSVVAPVFALFVLVVFPFVGLGGEVARRLAAFQRAGLTLQGYAFDLGGSLLGVMVFAVLSGAGAGPLAWFGAALLLALGAATTWRARAVHVVASAAVLLMAAGWETADRYSPYYAIKVETLPDGSLNVLTNGSLHQVAMDLREAAAKDPESRAFRVREGYQLAVENLAQPARRALVLGAGTGNDVTVLLDAGVAEIHAVEIDPVILDIGREQHPAHPYADPRVVIHNTDARAFLDATTLKFDLIVFGTLDSMTRLSALSNVRLDNFVYTTQCLEAARARLSPQGGLALFFMSASDAIDDHLFSMLDDAFGAPPLAYRGYHALFNRIYYAGPGFAHLSSLEVLHDAGREQRRAFLQSPDDDWPYLYLVSRGIPSFYLGLGALVFLFALISVMAVSKAMRGQAVRGQVDADMMLFGAAFLLLESSFVVQMNLLFGATWKTSTVVFGAMLATVLVATVVSTRFPVRAAPALLGVVVTLAMVAFLPLRALAPAAPMLRIAFAAAVCGVPVGFAALAFAANYRNRPRVEWAFGWNLLGAVLGGLLEFSSMALGLRAMFLVAALFYLALLWRALRGPVAALNAV